VALACLDGASSLTRWRTLRQPSPSLTAAGAVTRSFSSTAVAVAHLRPTLPRGAGGEALFLDGAGGGPAFLLLKGKGGGRKAPPPPPQALFLHGGSGGEARSSSLKAKVAVERRLLNNI
jgi:hypothetical protein